MGAKTPVLLVSIIHPEGAAVRKREKHAGVVTLRDGDGGRLLARLTHRIALWISVNIPLKGLRNVCSLSVDEVEGLSTSAVCY